MRIFLFAVMMVVAMVAVAEAGHKERKARREARRSGNVVQSILHPFKHCVGCN